MQTEPLFSVDLKLLYAGTQQGEFREQRLDVVVYISTALQHAR